MNVIISLAATSCLVVSCTGFGLLALTVFSTDKYLQSPLERGVSGFVVGTGIMGWLLFFPGVLGAFSPLLFWAVIVFGMIVFAVLHRMLNGIPTTSPTTGIVSLLLGILAISVGLDLLEAVSPPADADTLAYHFALPRDFVANGQITFVPRAVTGAIPLLLHMTYAAALATGGELALTLWVAITGWAPGLLLFTIVRRSLSRPWSLALLAIFVASPAVLYGGGNGQIEVRSAAFALSATVFLLTAQREASYRTFALAGICAGFFIGSKYFGLIFAGAAGLMILYHRQGLQRCLVFGLAALVAGFQWYLWNYIHTGDPIFPTLFNALEFPDTSFWTRDFGRYFSEALSRGELPLDRSITNWLLYPVYSIFNLVERLEGGRTGLGVASVLILPFAIIGLALAGDRRREMLVPLAIAGIFFTVWFFAGLTQRTRHLVPVYPLVLLALYPAAVIAAQKAKLAWPLATGLAAVIAIQLAGHAVFGVSYATHVFGHETRADYLLRNVPGANAVKWANENLPPTAKIGFMNRQFAYLIERPSYMLHPHEQVAVDTRPTVRDAQKFIAQLRKRHIDHLLLPGDWGNSKAALARRVPFFDMIGTLVDTGCLKRLAKFDTLQISSRTLYLFSSKAHPTEDWAFAVIFENCPFSGKKAGQG